MADQNTTPGGVPLLNTGWGADQWDFEPGEAFWAKITGLESTGGLVDQMDAAMSGKSSPRVWLIMHEPGQPELSAALALAFARELGHRDQAALVLDCDDQSQSLTRWTERLESEGWIDLARYGTSVLTSGVAMPFDGRRGYLLGVGSFAPTDVTSEEVAQLVQRLRRQADDLILVAPADAIGEMWASVAGIRLLCWDRSTTAADDLAGLVAGFAASGHELTGLMGFGEPQTKPAVVEVPEPVSEEVSADKPEPKTELKPMPETEIPPVIEDEVDPVAPADDFEEPQPDSAVASVANEAKRSGWSDAPPLEDDGPRQKGTSGVFWLVASFAVITVAILGVYWFKYGRVPESELMEPPVVVVRQDTFERLPADPVAGDMANQDDPAVDAVADEAPEMVPETVPEIVPEKAAVAETETSQADDTAVEIQAPAEPVVQAAPAEPVFTMNPYKDIVGAGGWALHLYSFPDSSSVNVELTELHRRGFTTEVRVVEIPEKGRWWRVYVGSFATKGDARDATPLLLAKLKTDWAKATRF